MLVLGRSSAASAWAGEQLASRGVGKVYMALTERPVAEDAFEVDRPLGRTGAGTLLECRPLTGRQHQIRAHLDLKGLPILGDLLYGPGEDWEHFDDLDERKHARADGLWHGLHCARMELPPGPLFGDLVLEAAPGDEFAAARARWRCG